MKVKGISWVGVGVDDFDAALSFFTDVMGLRPAAVDERGVAILHVSEGQVLEIFGPDTKGHELNSPPVVAFEVEDVTQARDNCSRTTSRSSATSARGTASNGLTFGGQPAVSFLSKKPLPPAGRRMCKRLR